MDRIQKEEHGTKTVLFIDYTGLKEKEMIEVLEATAEFLLKENAPRLVLVKFGGRGYISPAFMRRAEELNKLHGHLIIHQAFIGMSDIKKFILKGFNLFLGKNYQAFDTKEEALRNLLGISEAE